jgi:hypothetical protein
MHFLKDKGEFELNKQIISGIIESDKGFPEQVFKEGWKDFLFMEFDWILQSILFNRTKKFVQEAGGDEFMLAVLDPDPEKYWFKHFEKYSLLKCSVDDTEEDYLKAMNMAFGDSSADSLICNSNSILIYSGKKNWGFYAERSLEIGVCAFTDETVKNTFSRVFGSDMLDNIDQAIDLMGYGFKDSMVPEKLEKEFRKNYGSG